ncbi:MAG: TetR/AcrR family transcriptional regulator [Solirubrobacteraceae bacterium]|nr:TetR/AcrR family transcriptional regulator [Solirubrobacteraceae bacterium]
MPQPKRRTQAERRATTQAALLDATIDCLVDYGYVNTTTTRIAERAGVSRGAQVHHFPTKAALVTEALRHLAERRTAQLTERLPDLAADSAGIGEMLDLLWEGHSGAVFDATLELWVAARTDPVLRENLVTLERDVTMSMWNLAQSTFGEKSKDPEFREDMELVLAVVRGVALLRASSGEKSPAVERRWRAARERLTRLLARWA